MKFLLVFGQGKTRKFIHEYTVVNNGLKGSGFFDYQIETKITNLSIDFSNDLPLELSFYGLVEKLLAFELGLTFGKYKCELGSNRVGLYQVPEAYQFCFCFIEINKIK